jgi:hypothetical protein
MSGILPGMPRTSDTVVKSKVTDNNLCQIWQRAQEKLLLDTCEPSTQRDVYITSEIQSVRSRGSFGALE